MRLLPVASWTRQLQCIGRNPNSIFQTSLLVRCASSHPPTKAGGKEENEDPWANVVIKEDIRYKRASLDDYPIPKGSWQEAYDRRRRLGTYQLIGGLLLFGGTVFYMWYYDILQLKKALAPHHLMKNPPVFDSPKLEPNVLLEYQKQFPVEQPKIQGENVQKSAPLSEVHDASVQKPDKPHVPVGTPKPTHFDPSKIPEIPNHVPYLIIGGGTAAFSAFRAIRANNPHAAVLVVTEESYYPYMRPPLSKELWYSAESLRKDLRFQPMVSDKQRSIFFEHEEFYVDPKTLPFTEGGGVAVLKNMKVTSIDSDKQKAVLNNGWEIYYDRLLIAPGGKPRNLPCFEKAGEDVMKNVTVYRGVDDFKKLDSAMSKAKKVVIIGGGFLGSELACALAARGKSTGAEVHQVYPEKGNLARILPQYLSDWTTRKIETVDGVKVYPERFVTSARYSQGQVVIRLNNNEEIAADHVVVAVGIWPNTELANSAGLEVDRVLGGYKVNAELEAGKNIWVAGDAASYFDVTLGRRRMEHHDHAVATGRLAGENMLGKGNPFWHQSMFWSDLGPEIGFEAVGLVDSSLETVAVFAQNSSVDNKTKSSSQASSSPTNDTTENASKSLQVPKSTDDYSKGIIYYLKDRLIVGILMWNLFNHVSIARKVIKEQKTFEDLSDLAKLFNLHNDQVDPGDKKE